MVDYKHVRLKDCVVGVVLPLEPLENCVEKRFDLNEGRVGGVEARDGEKTKQGVIHEVVKHLLKVLSALIRCGDLPGLEQAATRLSSR